MEEIQEIKIYKERLKKELDEIIGYINDGLFELEQLEIAKGRTPNQNLLFYLKEITAYKKLLSINYNLIEDLRNKLSITEINLPQIEEVKSFIKRLEGEYNEVFSYREILGQQTEIEEKKFKNTKEARIVLTKEMVKTLDELNQKVDLIRKENESFLDSLKNQEFNLNKKGKELEILRNNLEDLEKQYKKELTIITGLKESLEREKDEVIREKVDLIFKQNEFNLSINQNKKEILKKKGFNQVLENKKVELENKLKELGEKNNKLRQKLEAIGKKEIWQVEFEKELEKKKIKLADERSLLERVKNEIYSKYG